MGRRKIEIQPLTDDRNRTVTFVKRKAGLFKKAHELSVLCQVDLAVIIIGSNNKIYEFSSVDTDDLIKQYQGSKAQETRSPENYNDYKKRSLRPNLRGDNFDTRKSYNEDEEFDEDDESESPEPKRKRAFTSKSKGFGSNTVPRPPPHHISMTNMPTFNNPNYRSIEEDVPTQAHHREELINSNASQSLRPILRVQIPTDGNPNSNKVNDSARTITAIDTNLQHTSDLSGVPRKSRLGSAVSIKDKASNESTNDSEPIGSALRVPNINKHNFTSFASPDTRRPTLPMPIHPKSQTSSPLGANAPQLPQTGNASSGGNQLNNLNSGNNNNMYFTSMPQHSPSNPYPPSLLPTPILNQVFNQQYPQQSQQDKLRQPMYQYPGSGGGNVEQLPVSGLPSRYVNDIFPSPSTFYAPQDWSNSNTGMTPTHSNIPQYFMNLLPGQTMPAAAGLPGQSGQSGQPGPSAPPSGYSNTNRIHTMQKNDGLPSPLHYTGSLPFTSNTSSSRRNPTNPTKEDKK